MMMLHHHVTAVKGAKAKRKNKVMKKLESEQLKASFAFAGDNAGMMVMAEYDRPPTETAW